MGQTISREWTVPRCQGDAFVLRRAEILRVIEVGGGQVADIRFFNSHDYREQFGAVWSMILNKFEGEPQTYFRSKRLYSKIPWERVMLTVVEDTVGMHTMGGNCSPRSFEIRGMQGHRSCSDNFADALQPFGITLADLDSAGVFNAFMPRLIDAEGNITYVESPARDGDHIDFRAEMDVLVAFSNCPSEPPVNPPGHRDFLLQIVDGSASTEQP